MKPVHIGTQVINLAHLHYAWYYEEGEGDPSSLHLWLDENNEGTSSIVLEGKEADTLWTHLTNQSVHLTVEDE